MHVHFMGIGGSGISGVALLAKAQGFTVSGCDKESQTPYLEKIKEAGIKVFEGHDASHLNDVDILAVTPATFFQAEKNQELIEGEKKKVITWEAFLGKYLQKDKSVISVAGTHGKSTTTSLLALLFESAQKNPWVMVGATVPSWNSNSRVGKSEIFITEADEFYDNFLNYHSDIIILNNIEFDHPDYFPTYKKLVSSFKKFVSKIKGSNILIVNQDSQGIVDLFLQLDKKLLEKIQVIGYTCEEKPLLETKTSIQATNILLNKNGSHFVIDGIPFSLSLPGKYSISNALGVIIAARLYKISDKTIKKSLQSFQGIGRRLEKIGVNSMGALIYDDYAHHPTAIHATLNALKQLHMDKKILAIVEPHTFSRTKALLKKYKECFAEANAVVIAPIFKSRDSQDFGVSGKSIVEVSNNENTRYIDSFDEIVKYCKKILSDKYVVIVMGAGYSYKLAREIASL